MAMTIRPLAPAVGAEIADFDLTKDLDDHSFSTIESTFNERGLLLFRKQRLSEQQHLDLSRRFGKLQDHVLKPFLIPGYPQILRITNILDKEGRPLGIGDAGTMFSSLTEVYDALDEATKRQIANLSSEHSFGKHYARMQSAGSKRPDLTEAQKREVPRVVHPVVRPHPITRRKALFVNDGYTTHILGTAQAESDALIEKLTQHTIKPEFTYRHRWEAGDLLIWDNSSTQHLAIADYALPQRRLMHRTTVLAT